MGAGRKRIILVDDITMHLMSTVNRLKSRYEVYPAKSAAILFEILGKIIPDLILLDINMPEISGFEIIQILKDNVRYADIPVIFLSGQDDANTKYKAMQLGAVDFLSKPFTDSDIIDRIEHQINAKKQTSDKPVILAVDDDPTILQSVNHALSEQYIVHTLPDSKRLSGLLKVITPDLFLLDYNMPDLTGFELVPVIRESLGHEKTPIIFLTSDGTNSQLSEAIRLGASDFIVKPVDLVILHEKIKKHLSSSE